MNNFLGFAQISMNDYVFPFEDINVNWSSNDYKGIVKKAQMLVMQMEQKQKENEAELHTLSIINQEREGQINSLSKELIELRRELLRNEKLISGLREEKQRFDVKINHEQSQNEYLKFQNEIYEKQISSLTDVLAKSELTISNLLKEKKELIELKLSEFLKTNVDFQEMKLSEYFAKSLNFNFDAFTNKLEESKKKISMFLNDSQDVNKESFMKTSFVNPNKTFNLEEEYKTSFIGKMDFSQAFANSNLREQVEFPGKIESIAGEVGQTPSKDLMIFFLKQQLLCAHIINQHFERIISSLEWKQVIEYGKAKIKSNLTYLQSKYISNLEKVVEISANNYKTLRHRIEDVEMDKKTTNAISPLRDFDFSAAIEFAPKEKEKLIKDEGFTPRRSSRRYSLIRTLNRKESLMDKEKTKDKKNDDYNPRKKEKEEVVNKIDRKDPTNEIDTMQKRIDEIKSETLPLTYENELVRDLFTKFMQKEELIKKYETEGVSLETGANNTFGGLPKINEENIANSDVERLRNKIMTLISELDLEAYEDLLIQVKNSKILTEQLEVSLRNNIKEENLTWQKTIQEVKDNYEKEIQKRHVDFRKLQEVINLWASKLNDLHQSKKFTKEQFDVVYYDLLKYKEMGVPNNSSKIHNTDTISNPSISNSSSIAHAFKKTTRTTGLGLSPQGKMKNESILNSSQIHMK